MPSISSALSDLSVHEFTRFVYSTITFADPARTRPTSISTMSQTSSNMNIVGSNLILSSPTWVGAGPSMTSSMTHQATTVPKAKVLSLFSQAKTLTAWLFGERSFPKDLSLYAPFMQRLGATAVVVGIYHLFNRRRQSRAKIQLAVFYILRIVERSERLQDLIREPETVIQLMENEVEDLLNRHITEEEGIVVMDILKRRLWTDEAEEPLRKRHRTEDEIPEVDEEEIEQNLHGLEDDVGQDGTNVANANSEEAEMLTASSESENVEERRSVIVERSPHSLLVGTREDHPANHVTPTRDGYGFSYDDFTPSSSSSSDNASPVDQVERDLYIERPNMVQRAMKRAFDLNSPGNQYALRAAKRLKVVKTQSDLPRTPPTTLGIASNYVVSGTRLSPIEEASSLTNSPDAGRTHYRVAETRRRYADLESRRKDKRPTRDFFVPGKAPPSSLGMQDPSPEKKSPLQKEDQRSWEDLIIEWSPQTSVDSESPSTSGDGLAPLVAPTKVLTWARSPISRQSFSSHISKASRSSHRPSRAIRSESADAPTPTPTTPVPPKKKRGRPPKTLGAQRSESMQNTSVRKTKRKTAYKGTFSF